MPTTTNKPTQTDHHAHHHIFKNRYRSPATRESRDQRGTATVAVVRGASRTRPTPTPPDHSAGLPSTLSLSDQPPRVSDLKLPAPAVVANPLGRAARINRDRSWVAAPMGTPDVLEDVIGLFDLPAPHDPTRTPTQDGVCAADPNNLRPPDYYLPSKSNPTCRA